MRILQNIFFVLLLTTVSSVYGGECGDGDVDDCLVKAGQGNADSQYNLGSMYEFGSGVSQDHKESVKWYGKPINQVIALVQLILGGMYDSGVIVPQDHKESVKWYLMAALRGNAPAQNNLGVMYYDGQGVVQDYKEAVKWWRLAAEQGNSVSQFNLGLMYAKGQGVLQDYVMAYMYWDNVPIRSYEEEDVVIVKRSISKIMTDLQIEKAQDLAREWMRKHQ